MPPVTEAVVYVDGVRTFYRRVAGDERPPVVFVHGNPTHSEEWVPFLDRVEGPAVALDLPGWGFSERPRADRFDYSLEGLGAFVERFLDALAIGEHSLVVTDWGVVALIAAQRRPERLRRLVLINAVPLLPGYRWHWVARLWRRRVVGELVNATTTRTGLRLLSALATPRRRPLPASLIDLVWRGRPAGSWPQMLALYRSADPERLAAAGAALAGIEAPALVIWGPQDPYIPGSFGRAYAERLPNAELVELEGAGHWPWLDRPEVIDRVARFVAG